MLPVSGDRVQRAARGTLPLLPLSAGSAPSLARHSAALTFFTPALLYLHGRFSDDVFVEFLHDRGVETPFYSASFAKPVFEGLESADGDPSWNHSLWAVRNADWPDVEGYVGSVKLTHTPSGRLFGCGLQRLTVLDPLFMDRAAVLPQEVPLLSLWAFCVDGNRSSWSFEADPRRAWVRPRPRRGPPTDECVAFARDVFAERNPYEAAPAPPVASASPELRFDRGRAAWADGALDLFRRLRAEGA